VAAVVGERQSQKLTLTNNTPRDACYKIKTTCVARYAVLPGQAVIPANMSVTVEIVLIKMEELPDPGSLRDRFLIQAAWKEDPNEDVTAFWKRPHDKSTLFQKKFSSELFLPDETAEQMEEECELGASHGRALASFVSSLPSVRTTMKTRAFDVSDVMDPKIYGAGNWVSDACNLFERHEVAEINGVCQRLFEQYGIETAVVTVKWAPGGKMGLRPFFTDLFNFWGIGSPITNNGLLVAMVMEHRRIEMVTGDGLRRVVTDSWLQHMQEGSMVPLFKAGAFGSGLVEGMHSIETHITAAAKSRWKEQSITTPGMELCGGHRRWHYGGGRRGYSGGERKSSEHQQARVVNLCVGVFLAFIGLLWWTRKEKCPACGNRNTIDEKVVELVPETCWRDGYRVRHVSCRKCG
jgi:hypothetical protein